MSLFYTQDLKDAKKPFGTDEHVPEEKKYKINT